MMRKFCFFLLVFLFLFFYSSSSVEARIVTIDKEGQIIWNVLSFDSSIALDIPQNPSLEVVDVTDVDSSSESRVSLVKEGENINLLVSTGRFEEALDVTGWEDDLVVIEERGETRKLQIGIKGNKFVITQEGATVETDYAINIDPLQNKLSVLTPSGEKYLAILPLEAAQSSLRAKVISDIASPLELSEEGGGDLYYLINGERVLNLFDLYDLGVPVQVKVSAATGEILFVDQPPWLRVVGFLFT